MLQKTPTKASNNGFLDKAKEGTCLISVVSDPAPRLEASREGPIPSRIRSAIMPITNNNSCMLVGTITPLNRTPVTKAIEVMGRIDLAIEAPIATLVSCP